MRIKRNRQQALGFQSSNLKVTRKYFARYEAIGKILEESPEIVDAVHKDLAKTVKQTGWQEGPGRRCEYATDTILRLLICQIIEGQDLRGIVVRVDDSTFLRRFVKIHDGPMMDYSSLCRFKNAIRPKTWKKVNWMLATSAVANGQIDGDQLRLDTTAYETNIGYPSDSRLLWDTYRVLSRCLVAARDLGLELLQDRRFQNRRVKKLHLEITRRAAKRGASSSDLVSLYEALVGLVETILVLVDAAASGLEENIASDMYRLMDAISAEYIASELRSYGDLGERVVDQTRRRVFGREKVPAADKLYSIFEPHTELLKRGKAGKPIEFGHMVFIQEVKGCFITNYDVLSTRPADNTLVDPALQSHNELFGEMPHELSADRAFHESSETTEALEAIIPVVSIPKMGKRNKVEDRRESQLAFKLAQAFRSGVEGTISYLKRALRMFRCFNKGWEHYVSTVGATIFTHNLLVLARTE